MHPQTGQVWQTDKATLRVMTIDARRMIVNLVRYDEDSTESVEMPLAKFLRWTRNAELVATGECKAQHYIY